MKVTNYVDRHGNERYRLQRKVGKRYNQKTGCWEDYIKSFYGSCYSEAERKYVEFMANKNTFKAESTTACLGEVMEEWIDNVFVNSEFANSTKVKYKSAFKRMLKPSFLAGQPLKEITAKELQDLYNTLEECYSSRRALHNLLIHFYRYAELNNLAPNVTKSLVVRGANKNKSAEIDVWQDDDLRRLIETLEGSTLRLLVVLAANTGARFAELLALRYDDVQDGILSISKQSNEIPDVQSGNLDPLAGVKTLNSVRYIPLADEVLCEIETHKKLQQKEMREKGYSNHGLIFTTSNGTMYYKRNVARSLERHYKRMGLPKHSFHAFRHTFATNLSRAGVAIEEVAKLLGNTVEVCAKYYVFVEARRCKKAVQKIVGYSLS